MSRRHSPEACLRLSAVADKRGKFSPGEWNERQIPAPRLKQVITLGPSSPRSHDSGRSAAPVQCAVMARSRENFVAAIEFRFSTDVQRLPLRPIFRQHPSHRCPTVASLSTSAQYRYQRSSRAMSLSVVSRTPSPVAIVAARPAWAALVAPTFELARNRRPSNPLAEPRFSRAIGPAEPSGAAAPRTLFGEPTSARRPIPRRSLP